MHFIISNKYFIMYKINILKYSSSLKYCINILLKKIIFKYIIIKK